MPGKMSPWKRNGLRLLRPILVYGDILLFATATYLKVRWFAPLVEMSLHEARQLSVLLIIFFIAAAHLLPGGGRRMALFILSICTSLLLAADVIHWRLLTDVMSLSELGYAWQVTLFFKSIFSVFDYRVLLFFADLPVWLLLLRARPAGAGSPWPNKWSVRVLAVLLSLSALLYGTRWVINKYNFESEFMLRNNRFLVERMGVLNYHLYDFFSFMRRKFIHRSIPPVQVSAIRDWFAARDESGEAIIPFGAARGENLIIIQVESLQGFLIDLKIGGVEVTPNVNRLAKENLFIADYYSETNPGSTSDVEYSVLNSLIPCANGAMSYQFPENYYEALPKIMRKNGYHTCVAHSMYSSFWNRGLMNHSYGFETAWYKPAFSRDTGMDGVPDGPFLEQLAGRLASLRRPFFLYVITLSSHTPFTAIPVAYKNVGFLRGTAGLYGDYLRAIHYADASLGVFIEKLKEQGLYDRSVIILMGDHEGLPKEERRMWLSSSGKKWDPLIPGRVPLIFHLPGAGRLPAEGIMGSSLDIAPTVVHLLGLSRASTYFVGENLFLKNSAGLVPFRNGSFMSRSRVFFTPDATFKQGNCFSFQGGGKTNRRDCRDGFRAVKKRKWVSRMVAEGNLLEKFKNLP